MSLVHLVRIKPRQTCQHLHTGNHTKALIDNLQMLSFIIHDIHHEQSQQYIYHIHVPHL